MILTTYKLTYTRCGWVHDSFVGMILVAAVAGVSESCCLSDGGAQHGFTHKHASPGATPGVAYNSLADNRSFAATRAFLAETFAPAA